MSQFFTSGGQSIGASASASVLPMYIQDWCPLGWIGWISLQSKGLSRVFPVPLGKLGKRTSPGDPGCSPVSGHSDSYGLNCWVSVSWQSLCPWHDLHYCVWTPLTPQWDAGKDWRQKEKGTAEDEMVIQHHQCNGHESEQTPGDSGGQRNLACCSPWGHRESGTT